MVSYRTYKSVALFFGVLLVCTSSLFAQSDKKNKTNKGTSPRDIQKRQQAANDRDDSNIFNPKHVMGARSNDNRDDLLWNSETANTVYHKAGNISVTTPSRYGVKPQLEVFSTLGLDYWTPNLGIKKNWRNHNLYLASKHVLYSGTPGFNWAQERNRTLFVDSGVDVPVLVSMRNEFIMSYVFSTKGTCSRPRPFLILTGNIGGDYGVPIGAPALRQIDGHFLTNRSAALTGRSGYAYAKLRADWQINGFLVLGGGVSYFYGDFTGNHAYEHPMNLQLFISTHLSISAGYIMSYANYSTPNSFAVMPFADISIFFGQKQSRDKGLFRK